MNDKLLLLGILHQQEMHGYQLYEFIERDLAACTDLKKPTAYYLLNKMAEDGWVVETQTQEGNRPPRKVYRLTSQGETAFRQLLDENLAEYRPVRFSDDIGLAFLDEMDPADALNLLQQRCQAVKAALQAVRVVPEHQGSPQWIIEHQRHHLASELEWVERVIANLERQV
jgi:DNA-binding PadR family transcriptional regulator